MISKKVAMIGAGMTAFHHKLHANKMSREIFSEAAIECTQSVDKGIDLKDIDALMIGNLSSDAFEHQSHTACLMADWFGLRPIPSIRIENACASSGVAFQMGVMAVASGLYDTVMVGGVEKMTRLNTEEVTDALAMCVDNAYEFPSGITNPALYAMMAIAHFNKYGSKWEQLAAISIKNHHNAALNSKAQFQSEVMDMAKKVEAKKGVKFKDAMDYMKSSYNPIVAYPLRVFDCCPISDGAAALILTSVEKAKKYTDTPIYIKGIGQASDTMAYHDRPDLTSLKATVDASNKAYKMANLDPKDINLAMVHDCFTSAEVLAIEDLGFFEKGEGGKAAEEGKICLDGEIPINTDGGLKARGHAVGATGAAMIYEVWKQLRGEAGKRQVSNAEIGLTQNIGVSGGTAAVQIFGR
jgi:acetyl-CoA C-acetyltransferase